MELETVLNYLANSTNLDGVRAEEIKSLAADVQGELTHASQIASRIKTIDERFLGASISKLVKLRCNHPQIPLMLCTSSKV